MPMDRLMDCYVVERGTKGKYIDKSLWKYNEYDS